jgi:hypothetical protein
VLIAAGHKLYKETVSLSGDGRRLSIQLAPAATRAGSAGLKVRCKTSGELRILVDGVDTGELCPNDARIAVEPGKRLLQLYNPRTDTVIEQEVVVKTTNGSTRVYTKY